LLFINGLSDQAALAESQHSLPPQGFPIFFFAPYRNGTTGNVDGRSIDSSLTLADGCKAESDAAYRHVRKNTLKFAG
jgi:hypothetical protein